MMAEDHPSEKLTMTTSQVEPQYTFTPDRTADPWEERRLARSHAVSRGLANKRKLQQKAGLNFRVVSLTDDTSRPAKGGIGSQTVVAQPSYFLVAPPSYFSACPPGPFQMLAAESPKLQALQGHHNAQQVFSVSNERVLENFRSVLREGLDDHALLSAVMLTFAFEETAGSINRCCLGYQGEALRSIRRRMSSPDIAPSESTLGTILLLAGIEARLGMPCQVQLHMGAVHQLLSVCRTRGVYLSDGIKRAIFWQDLNSSVMTGSRRIVDHTTFPELHWRKELLPSEFYTLPSGFQAQAQILGPDFIGILTDIYALQCVRDSDIFSKDDAISMRYIDNHQASIQSRLVSLPNYSSISECCHLAAYLCSAMLRCKIWGASTIPPHLSSKLLYRLQETSEDKLWDDCPALLTWILHMGGAFAPTGDLRSDYIALVHLNRSSRLEGMYSSWPELLRILKKFICSEKAFLLHFKAFWEESSA
ncbi:hypothetical protein LSUE1_G001963 [Lachnellula suecica]|uniref:Transcription factor domain-containing protein n=1 Tax=Lachnellula suecica TaxID=602035 RepID=A0A8T9CFA7_9HELO|nr:hypothetical protein LSUE1_G001963 [Lachnellula suecica]